MQCVTRCADKSIICAMIYERREMLKIHETPRKNGCAVPSPDGPARSLRWRTPPKRKFSPWGKYEGWNARRCQPTRSKRNGRSADNRGMDSGMGAMEFKSCAGCPGGRTVPAVSDAELSRSHRRSANVRRSPINSSGPRLVRPGGAASTAHYSRTAAELR